MDDHSTPDDPVEQLCEQLSALNFGQGASQEQEVWQEHYWDTPKEQQAWQKHYWDTPTEQEVLQEHYWEVDSSGKTKNWWWIEDCQCWQCSETGEIWYKSMN